MWVKLVYEKPGSDFKLTYILPMEEAIDHVGRALREAENSPTRNFSIHISLSEEFPDGK